MMLRWLKDWWKRRGERLCAANKHAWRSGGPPANRMGTGVTFAANLTVSMFYDWAHCKRCGKVGCRLPLD